MTVVVEVEVGLVSHERNIGWLWQRARHLTGDEGSYLSKW